MTAQLLIAVPVLDRPKRAYPLVTSVRAATSVEHRIVFLCSPGDEAEILSCKLAGADEVIVVEWAAERGGDYPKKINEAVRASQEPWIFTGADDLDFHPGWAEAALACASAASVRVVGTNDLGNPRVMKGQHSTHNLVARSYIEEHGTIDESGLMMHEGYSHCFCDDELVVTAKRRKEYVFCGGSEVKHLHPHWTHGPRDATYDKGERMFAADRIRFNLRSPLWR